MKYSKEEVLQYVREEDVKFIRLAFCDVFGENTMKTKTRFAWKQFLKNLAIIAIPVALQNMLTTTGSMIDTMMIAPLGETTVPSDLEVRLYL